MSKKNHNKHKRDNGASNKGGKGIKGSIEGGKAEKNNAKIKAKKIDSLPIIEDITIPVDDLPSIYDPVDAIDTVELAVKPQFQTEPVNTETPVDAIQTAILDNAQEILNTYKTLFVDKGSDGLSIIENIEKTQEKTQHYKDKAEQAREDMLRLKGEAETIVDALQSGDKIIQSLVDELSGVVKSAEDKIQALDEGYSNLFGSEFEKSRWQEIMDAYHSLNSWRDEVYGLRNELFGYQELLFDEQISPEEAKGLKPSEVFEKDGVYYRGQLRQHSGLKDEFDREFDQLKKQAENQQNAFDEDRQKTKRLHDEICDLLPSAMRAGFSDTYQDAQKAHQQSADNWQKVLYGSLAVFMLIAIIGYAILNVNMQSVDAQGLFLLQLLPFELPVVFLIILSAAKAGQHNRFVEEYRHKQTVAVNFERLRKASADLSAELPETSVQNKLYSHTLNMYSENPVTTIHDVNDNRMQTNLPE